MLPDAKSFDRPETAGQYEGSPFLDKTWRKGSVRLVSGETRTCTLKYFVYGQEIWMKQANDSIYQLNLSEQIAEITLGEKTFIYIPCQSGGQVRNGILEVLYAGKKCSLLQRHGCTLKKGREANGYQEKEKDRFEHKASLYCRFNGQTAVAIPRSIKEFLPLFGRQEELIRKYMKEKKLKMKAEDLKKVLAYYESIA